jgi:hypothetical protein
LGIYRRRNIWWIDYYFKGERLREPVSSSRKEAMEALEARRGDIVRGRFELVRKNRRQTTFEDFACEHLKRLKATHRWWRREMSRMKSTMKDERKMAAVELISGWGTEGSSLHVSRGDGHRLVTIPDLAENGQYVSH